jgi:DNA polymerase-4
VQAILAPFSPVTESVSEDAVFIELRRCPAFSGAQRAALRIRRTAAGPYAERCAVGIGPNRLIAYMASGLAGGGRIVRLTSGSFRERCRSAPVERLPGVGKESAGCLGALGVYTIGQLADVDPERLMVALGVEGERLRRLARGEDDTPVSAAVRPKALGAARWRHRARARLGARPSPGCEGLLRAG